jgi:hypothetical protein
MDITNKLLFFFGTLFFQTGFSISTLFYYPYFEHKYVLLLYIILITIYTYFFLYNIINFCRINSIEEYIKIIFPTKIYIIQYLLLIIQIFLLMLVISIQDQEVIKFCNIMFFFTNIFYVLFLHLTNINLSKIEIEPSFDNIVKGVIITEVKDDFECSICLTNDKKNKFKLECHHIFHFECLEESYNNNHRRCPMCRQSFV